VDVWPGAPELCDGKDNNCNGVVDENGCQSGSQKIMGRITNLNDAEQYISDASYLQLVMFTTMKQLVSTTDAQGRRTYISDLAVIDMPSLSNDSFVFETYGLLPGQYVIAAQSLEPYAQGSEEILILATTDGQPAIIAIPEDGDLIFEVDLGKLNIPVPPAVVTLNALAADTVPDMPNGVSATDGDFEDKIRVTWNASSGATSYDVFRANSFSGKKVKVTTTSKTLFDDTNLSCDEDYYYWVMAKNSAGSSALFYSDLGFIRCPFVPEPQPVVIVQDDEVDDITEPEAPLVDSADNVILDSPTGTKASDGTYPDKITISWNAVPQATSYDIYRTFEDCCGKKIKIGSSINTTHDDFNVKIGDYFYWIKANNVDGTSEFGYPDHGYIMVRPFAPTGVTASDGTYFNKVLVQWNLPPKASSYAGGPCCPTISDKKPIVTSYEIYRARLYSDPKILIGTTTTNQFYDTELPCSQCCRDTYVYWVKAVNAAGSSNFSEDDTGYVYQTLCDPDVSATDGFKNCVWVSWEPVNGATGYELYRSDSEFGKKTLMCSIANPCDYIFRDNMTTCPKVYYYWVKAIDSKGYTSCMFGNFDTGYCESE
jgi:fibronectin type 3 domain-containing protein